MSLSLIVERIRTLYSQSLLYRVNRAVVITFFYITVAMHVTSHDVRVIEMPICTIMQHSTYKSASITKKSVLVITIFIKITALKEKATGEKGPATALKLGTYALSRSFRHASHGNRLRSSVPHKSNGGTEDLDRSPWLTWLKLCNRA